MWIISWWRPRISFGETDFFGIGLSIDDDTLAVGASDEASNQTKITNDNSTASSNNSNADSGASYVYSFK